MAIAVTQKTIKVLGVDDHELVMSGLGSRLDHENDIELVGGLPDGERVIDEVRRTGANVVLLDLEMPGPDPFEVIGDLKRMFPDVRVIVLSAHIRDHYVDAAVRAGAWGYVSKNDEVEEIINAIRRVTKGEFVFGSLVLERCQLIDRNTRRLKTAPVSKMDLLTPRETQVLRMIGRGLGRKEIADELHRSPRTIDNHRASIMRKLNITDRVELVRYAIREGLVEI